MVLIESPWMSLLGGRFNWTRYETSIFMNLITIKKFDCPQLRILFTHDSKFLVSGSWRGEISILRVPELIVWNSFSSECRMVFDLALHPHEQEIAVAGFMNRDTKCEVLDWNGVVKFDASAVVGEVSDCVNFSPSGRRFLARADIERIAVFDWPSRRLEFKLTNTGERTTGIEFHPDGQTLALACSWQGGSRVAFRRLDDPTSVFRFLKIKVIYDVMRSAVFSPCGGWLGLAHKGVELYSFPSLERMPLSLSYPVPLTPVMERGELWSNVVFPANTSTLVCGSPQGTLVFWDIKTGKIIQEVKAHENTVRRDGLVKSVVNVAVSPDGQYLASSGSDDTLKLWRL